MMSNGGFCTDDLLRFSNRLFNYLSFPLIRILAIPAVGPVSKKTVSPGSASKLHGFLVAGLGVTPANAIPADR